jgi:hypothetical protein
MNTHSNSDDKERVELYVEELEEVIAPASDIFRSIRR